MICFAVHSQTGVNTEIEHRKKVIILLVTVVFAVAVDFAVAVAVDFAVAVAVDFAVAVAVATFIILL